MFALLTMPSLPQRLHLDPRSLRALPLLFALFNLLGMALLMPAPAQAQDADEKAQNLANCLARKGPSKCKKQWLNPGDVLRVEEIERNENQRVCLTGRTPENCDRALLSLKDIQLTIVAERRENLKSCLMGFSRERRACRKDWLSEVDLKRVEAAEQTRDHCANGRGGSECGALLLPPKSLKPTPVTAAASRPTSKPTSAKTAATSGPSAASVTAPSAPPAPAMAENAAISSQGEHGDNEFSTCEVDQFVESVSSEGRVAELQDGSIWVVSVKDAAKILRWALPAYVVACEGRLIHGETGEIIAANMQR